MKLEGVPILVVEDDPFIAMDIRQTLESAGALVVGPAYNLADALHVAEVANLRAAVLDLRLERGDTLPVATRLFERCSAMARCCRTGNGGWADRHALQTRP
jgi:DNA-binding response OmpR family regulator